MTSKEDLEVGMQFLVDDYVATITELRTIKEAYEVQILWLALKSDLVEAPRWHPSGMILDCINKYGWQALSSLHKELI